MSRIRIASIALTFLTAAGVVALAPGAAVQAADPQLADRAAAAGLTLTERTWSAAPVDYDNDGDQDVLIVNHQHANGRLYSSNGNGTYTWVARTAWPRVNSQGGILDRHDCAWADVDGNGLQDAYCSGGRNKSNYVKTAVKDNELWFQTSVGVFVDRGTEWGVGDACGRGRYVAFLDVNNDGWQDLFLSNQAGRNVSDPCDNPANGLPNEQSKIFLNNAGRSLTYAPAWNVSQPNSGVSCALPLDYNKDGRMDLLACKFHQERPLLYRNTGTGFAETSASVGLTAITDAVTGDLNNDGLLDLVTSDDNGWAYRLGTATSLAAQVRLGTAASGTDGVGIAVGDINGDGRQDVYAQAGRGSGANPDDRVFVNQGSLRFTSYVPPSATGQANAVVALTQPAGTPVRFLVLNGLEQQDGPYQLITWAG
ncbi:FG-GAP repeat domain-containing protein [Nocardioides sp.]|uniref:FG-GAP repeat domain-containing protein n=1 Tax=Nocardioides sp. TaxID=35761 RepID=UPI003D136541